MATASRTLRSRLIYSYVNSQWRSSKSQFHTLAQNLLTNPADPLSPAGSQCEYKLMRLFSMNNRFMCSATANPTTIRPSGAADVKSGSAGNGEKDSGESQNAQKDSGESQNAQKGKDSGESQNTQKGNPIRGGPVSWLSFFLLVCTGAGLVYYYDREKKRHIEGLKHASTAVKEGPSAGKADIGGPFNLIDHNGKPVTEKDFLGQWNLFYFGFTHCPEICPDELLKLASAIDKIKKKSGKEVVPVFISVDPERDTVEQVGEYVKEFHPKLIGLTGKADEVKKVARAYRVYYMKTEEEGSDYLVDHSIAMYLMDPDMEYVQFFGKNNDEDTLTDGVIEAIKQHNKVKA